MKHYFIINKNSGKKFDEGIIEKIKEVSKDLDYEIYFTKGVKDATNYVKKKCQSSQEMRFYAFGGDGTLNEVASGLVGVKNASLAVYPCGSGNDFVRYFKDIDFTNLKELINKKAKPIDIIKVNDRFSINVANMGLDADVNAGVIELKKKMKIEKAYRKSILKRILQPFGNNYKFIIDDKEIIEGNFLLGCCANGSFYGGGYNCAPNAKIDDGLIDFCAIRKVSKFKFLKLVPKYKKGELFKIEKYRHLFEYRQCKKIIVDCDQNINLAVDGENIVANHFEIEILAKAINFVY